MLFGSKLESEVYQPWKEYYVNYVHLKKLLKEGVILQNNWTDKDEQNFVAALDSDLEKVYTFQANKYDELNDQLNELQAETESAKTKFDVNLFSARLELVLQLAQELNHFQRLNYTGFIKIVKKHDRIHPQFLVKPLLNVRLKNLPFHSEDYLPLLYKISALFQFLRDNYDVDRQLSKLLSFNEEPQGFQLFKFWIHPDNLMEVKATILRHLPVLVYNNQNRDGYYDDDDDDDDDEDANDDTAGHLGSKNDPTITCLYFDNPNFELYNSHLVKNPNLSTLRIKWIGKLANKPKISFEKKNFDVSEDQFAVNEKITVKEKNVAQVIANKFNVEKHARKLAKRGDSEADVKHEVDNITNLQSFIQEHSIQPCVRTVYKRTAFQIPGDDKARIVIDSDLIFIREDAFDEDRPIRDPTKWHRTDIDLGVANPFSLLRKGEYSKFPYASMEIKVKTRRNKRLVWIDDLVNLGLIKEIPNFSKFIHGVASLFLEDDKLNNVPLWFNELEADLKIDPQQAYIENHKKLLKQQNDDDNILKFKLMIANLTSSDFNHPRLKSFLGQLLEDYNEEAAASGDKSVSFDPVTPKKVVVPNTPPQDLDQSLEDFDEDFDDELGGRPTALKNWLAIPSTFSKLMDIDSEDEEIELPAGVAKPDLYIKNAGPLKIEPKVWLANERTFNRWLHVTTLLSTLTFVIYSSTNLANSYQLSEVLAYIYFGLTLFSGVWGYYIFLRRREIIMERSSRHLDNVIGPLVVAVGLIVGLTINFVFGFRHLADQKKATFSTAGLNDSFYERNPVHKAVHEFVFKLVGM